MTRSAPPPRGPEIEDRRTPSSAAVRPIRRYRLSQLRLDARISDPASRFEHLKRTYD